MSRRWTFSLLAIGLTLGSLMAAGPAASAAPAARPAATNLSSGNPGGVMLRPGGAHAQAKAGGHATDQSTNWSGYAATGSTGAFSSVSASWTEPTGTCSSNTRRGQTFSSFWVGLDGFSSSSVEQTGTEVDCNGKTADYFGWYEMFPAAPVNFSNPVSPGDKFSASVTFSGTATYTLVLKDLTRGWTQNIVKSQSGLARSSAEVITEAPSSSSGVLPLADFGTVSYSVSAANGTSLGTQSPTEIIMVDSSGRQEDSTSSIAGNGAFSNTWLRST